MALCGELTWETHAQQLHWEPGLSRADMLDTIGCSYPELWAWRAHQRMWMDWHDEGGSTRGSVGVVPGRCWSGVESVVTGAAVSTKATAWICECPKFDPHVLRRRKTQAKMHRLNPIHQQLAKTWGSQGWNHTSHAACVPCERSEPRIGPPAWSRPAESYKTKHSFLEHMIGRYTLVRLIGKCDCCLDRNYGLNGVAACKDRLFRSHQHRVVYV